MFVFFCVGVLSMFVYNLLLCNLIVFDVFFLNSDAESQSTFFFEFFELVYRFFLYLLKILNTCFFLLKLFSWNGKKVIKNSLKLKSRVVDMPHCNLQLHVLVNFLPGVEF